MIGFRHTPQCLCGCHLVVGLEGVVAESYPSVDIAIVRFKVPNAAGGESYEREVAYTVREVA